MIPRDVHWHRLTTEASLARMFLAQFADYMILVLLGAAAAIFAVVDVEKWLRRRAAA